MTDDRAWVLALTSEERESRYLLPEGKTVIVGGRSERTLKIGYNRPDTTGETYDL